MRAAIFADKNVKPRRAGISITPYELRVFPEHLDGDRRRRGREAIVTLARVTSGTGCPRWLARAADALTQAAPTTVEAARAIVQTIYADRRRAPRREPSAARLIADPGWLGDTPITPEQILADAGIDSARQAAYQRRMSALLSGRAS